MNTATLNLGAASLGGNPFSFRETVLPWAVVAADDVRFKRIYRAFLLLALLVMLGLALAPPIQLDRKGTEALPPPLAKLLLERAATPPAPPPPPVLPTATPVAETPKPTPAELAKPAPKPPKEEKPLPKPDPRAPVPEARSPQPNKAPGEALEGARRRASGVGLLAASSEIAAIAAAPAAVQLRQDIATGPGVGTTTGVGVGAGTEAGIPERAMITAAAGRGSGGLNNAAVSRDTGGGGLAGRATTVVEGFAGGGGGGGAGGGGAARGTGGKGAGAGPAATPGGNLARGGGGKASRSIEDVKLVFERNKGAIYALYNRALRDDPSLQGKVVLELKIAPDGTVTSCRVINSELKNEDLERKLVARVRQFDFGNKDVEPMVVSWPVDFLPS
jgi:periplasmic protein TonB